MSLPLQPVSHLTLKKKKNASREETEQVLRKQSKKQNSNNDNNNKKLRQFNISRNTRKASRQWQKHPFPPFFVAPDKLLFKKLNY